jgi:adenylate cyclase
MSMQQNIEIKARLENIDRTRMAVEQLASYGPELLQQEDIFFLTRRGRLKLRIQDQSGELIYYERDDQAGPKTSRYLRLPVSAPELAREMLGIVHGIRGIVRKSRTLYRIGAARIHLDKVENLGDFIELEVVLQPEQSVEDGVRIARDLINQLEISEGDLVQGAYIDLLDEVGMAYLPDA